MRHRHKFHAQPTEFNGQRYDSKKEARYAQELSLRQKAGQVVFWLRQVPFHLPGGVVYRVDFQEFLAGGDIRFVDVKGRRTESYKAKKRMVEALYPVTIEEA